MVPSGTRHPRALSVPISTLSLTLAGVKGRGDIFISPQEDVRHIFTLSRISVFLK